MTLGKRGLFGYEWVARSEFVKDIVMTIKGTQIRIDAFVKFVRNKLGGGHLDASDRKRWQRELMGMSRYYEKDSDFLNHHMREVLRAVSEGIDENRIEQHTG